MEFNAMEKYSFCIQCVLKRALGTGELKKIIMRDSPSPQGTFSLLVNGNIK